MTDENLNTPKFSAREIRLIENCRVYAANDPAGLPDHDLMIIVAKLSALLIGGELEKTMPTPPNFKIIKISSVAARDIQAGEILEYRIRGRRMKACTVQDIKVGQDMFWYGILPIGVAGRDIPAGSIIDYKPNENTADVIATKERKNADPPQL